MTDRLFQFIQYQDVSIRKFEQGIGISQGTLNKAIKNKTDIQSKWLRVIVENFPKLSLDWLVLGEGEMLRPNFSINDSSLTVKDNTNAVVAKDSTVKGTKIVSTIEEAEKAYVEGSSLKGVARNALSIQLKDLEYENKFLKEKLSLCEEKVKMKDEMIEMLKSMVKDSRA